MTFILMAMIAVIPIVIGVAILSILKRTKLAFSLFIFLIFASIWQIDVAVLYASPLLDEKTIEFLFRAFRFGSIFLTPSMYYIAYIICTTERVKDESLSRKWIINKFVLWGLFFGSLCTYLLGWSKHGIVGLEAIEFHHFTDFLFPINGEYSWMFQTNVILFIFSGLACFRLSKRMESKSIRSFLIAFTIIVFIGYLIGIGNMTPVSRLYPSGIAVLLFAISILILVTKLHEQEINLINQELQHQRGFLKKIIDVNPHYIYAKDQDGAYLLANNSFAELFCKVPTDLIGKTDREIFADEPWCFLNDDQTVLKKNVMECIPEASIYHQNGAKKWLQITKIPLENVGKKVLLVSSSDITERKIQEERIWNQAHHDVLTGIPNRRHFNQKIKKMTTQNRKPFGLFLIDLDRFKNINDTVGHNVGDLVLIEIAHRLNAFVDSYPNSEPPLLFRIGGDEFILVIPCENEVEAENHAACIIKHFEQPFYVENHLFYLSPSIGISLYPKDGLEQDTLLKNADTAMYYVKEHGKNGFKVFSQEMRHKFIRKMLIEEELRRAIETNEFQLHYQPIFDVKAQTLHGIEVLLRWTNKNLGNVLPSEFIPVAEETGFIQSIGPWVIREACKQNILWQKKGYPAIKMAINLSILELMNENFITTMEKAVHEFKSSVGQLELELTETIAMKDQEVILTKLHALRNMGFKLAIDDFGTGYSSLSYLKKYPIDTLKIDKSFVGGIKDNKENAAIVKSILSIAKNLQVKVVAEGVETREELEYLKEIECDYVQGYYLGIPLNGNHFERNVLSTVNMTNVL